MARSRLEIDEHFMTDVLAGALVGSVHGQLVFRASNGSARVEVGPMRSAPGLSLTLAF